MALGIGLWVLIIVVVIMLLWFIFGYNSFVRLRNRINNAWSQIDVQLKRRFDLIPNLMESVKGYMKHERGVLKEVTSARTEFMKAHNPKDMAKAEGHLAGALKSLFAVAENYPNLRASENFMQLQEELSGTESKISYARQHYNDSVLEYNNKCQMFPSRIIAGLFSFKEREFFDVPESERKNVKVSF